MSSILVLGGTSWLGGVVAATAVADAHEVTCLARGQSGRVPGGARLVVADRDEAEAYAALPGGAAYDLVVDVARQPGHVRGALSALSDRARAWVLVSSCSVYARQDEPGADERAALLPALDGEVATPEQYGEGKVACERAVSAARGRDALIARSGLIVGKGDESDRFGYWPGRFALAADDGGPVLVPAAADRPVQWVHVGDLARWVLDAGLSGATGTVNAMGAPVALADVLEAAAAAAGFRGEAVPVTDEALAAAGVQEFMGPRSLPLWLHDPGWSAFLDRSTEAAHALGLTARPLSETMAACLDWERELGLNRPRTRAGLDRSDELVIIDSV